MSARSFRSALGLKSTLFSVAKDGSGTRIDDANTNILYLGAWTRSATTSASGGSLLSADSHARASITFQGSYLAVIAKTAPYYGQARMTLDGGEPVTVDYYSPAVQYQQKVYETAGLAEGTHTLRIEWTGTKNPSSWAAMIGVDAFDITGSIKPCADLPPRYEESDSHLSYGGPWAGSSVSSASGGAQKTLNSSGSVTATFDATASNMATCSSSPRSTTCCTTAPASPTRSWRRSSPPGTPTSCAPTWSKSPPKS